MPSPAWLIAPLLVAAVAAAGTVAEAPGMTRQLLQAAGANDVAALRALLADGALPEVRDARGRTPLPVALRHGGTALIPAAERGHVATVRMLIDAGVDLDHVNHLGWTALLEAILLGEGGPRHQAIVRLLIDAGAGADVDLADGEGVTPLQHARRRQPAIAQMLPAAGAR